MARGYINCGPLGGEGLSSQRPLRGNNSPVQGVCLAKVTFPVRFLPAHSGRSSAHQIVRHAFLDQHLLDGDYFERMSLENSVSLKLSVQTRCRPELRGGRGPKVYRFS